MVFKLEDPFIKAIFRLLDDGTSSRDVHDKWTYRTAVIDGPLDRIIIYSDDYFGFPTIRITYLSDIVFWCNIEDGEVITFVFENGHWANVVNRYKMPS